MHIATNLLDSPFFGQPYRLGPGGRSWLFSCSWFSRALALAVLAGAVVVFSGGCEALIDLHIRGSSDSEWRMSLSDCVSLK